MTPRRLTFVACALLALPAALAGPLACPRASAQEAQIQTNDLLVYRSGEKVEGKVLEEKSDAVRFRRRDSQSAIWISRDLIERIEYAETPEHYYHGRAGKLADGDAPAHLELARFCFDRNLEREAEAEAEKALKADPASCDAFALLSRVYRARYGKVDAKVHADVRDKELGIYARAEKAGCLSIDLRLVRSRLLRECGLPEQSLDELIKVEAALPPEGAAAPGGAAPSPVTGTGEITSASPAAFARAVRLELGNLALEVNRADVAARAFAALSGAAPDDAGATTGAGLAAFARGELEQAAKLFDRASELEGTNPVPHVLRAAVAVHEGDLREAEKQLQLARIAAAGGGGTLSPLGGEGSLYGAVAAALAGRLVTARARLSHVDPAPPFGAEAALVDGLASEIGSDPAAALAAYDRASELDPAFAGVARVARAQLQLGRGDRAAAEDSLKEAARAGYDFADVASLLSRSRRDAGDYATAVRYARYAADARPKDADILYSLGRSYLGAGKPDDAEAAFDAAIAVEPDHALALAGKGRVLYGRGDFSAAEALFARAAKIDHDLGYVSLGMQRINEARTRRLWRDEFDRSGGRDVLNRWTEEERFGIEAALSGGKLTFTGAQTAEDMGLTSVVRDVEGERFAELRAAIDPAGAGKARTGIRLATREGEIAYFRSPEGRLLYAVRSNASWSEPKDIGAWPAAPGPHEMWIGIGGPNRDNVLLGIDDVELASLKLSSFGRVNAFRCSIYVQVPMGAKVDVSCERALLFIARPEKAKKREGP